MKLWLLLDTLACVRSSAGIRATCAEKAEELGLICGNHPNYELTLTGKNLLNMVEIYAQQLLCGLKDTGQLGRNDNATNQRIEKQGEDRLTAREVGDFLSRVARESQAKSRDIRAQHRAGQGARKPRAKRKAEVEDSCAQLDHCDASEATGGTPDSSGQ